LLTAFGEPEQEDNGQGHQHGGPCQKANGSHDWVSVVVLGISPMHLVSPPCCHMETAPGAPVTLCSNQSTQLRSSHSACQLPASSTVPKAPEITATRSSCSRMAAATISRTRSSLMSTGCHRSPSKSVAAGTLPAFPNGTDPVDCFGTTSQAMQRNDSITPRGPYQECLEHALTLSHILELATCSCPKTPNCGTGLVSSCPRLADGSTTQSTPIRQGSKPEGIGGLPKRRQRRWN